VREFCGKNAAVDIEKALKVYNDYCASNGFAVPWSCYWQKAMHSWKLVELGCSCLFGCVADDCLALAKELVSIAGLWLKAS
jgi:hypothetical protein